MKPTPLLALICAAAIVGCEPVSEPDYVATSPNFGRGPVVESASGSGSFIVDPPGDRRTFSFTAKRFADGSVEGQWERIRRQDGNAADSKSHGVVTCFTIIGNQAWVGGMATSGVASDPPNNETAFRVVDNGQGKNAPADQMSLQFVSGGPGFAAGYCDATPESPALRDIESGNIQVKQ